MIPYFYFHFKSYFHPDHLGSSSYVTGRTGVVTQHMEYLPFGETLTDEHINSKNSPFKYNGKEYDEETGNYYYGARYYDPKLSNFISVDPLTEETMSPYGYCYNNPINMTDPTGMEAEDAAHIDHTIVQKNADGTYRVTGGKIDDDAGIYVDNGKGGKGEKIGTSKTTHSFVNEEDEFVIGAQIDLKSTEGQDFINQVIKDDPSLLGYMVNATNEADYDFKSEGAGNKEGAEKIQHYYRGSVDVNGKIGSARDFGNYAAGLVAARNGLSWGQCRVGFDIYQGYKSNGIQTIPIVGRGIPIPIVVPVGEAPNTIKAQQAGYNTGIRMFKNK